MALYSGSRASGCNPRLRLSGAASLRLPGLKASSAALTVVILTVLLVVLVLPSAGVGSAVADGCTWIDTRGPGNGTAYALAYVPSRHELYRGTNRGVWRYDEVTGNWSDTGGAVSLYTVLALLWDGCRIYAGTSLHGVWCYDVEAGTWRDISGVELANKSVNELAWDGTFLYAGIYNQGVWRYDPVAAVWTDISGELSGTPVQALQWDGSGLYVGTAGTWYYEPASGTWTNVSGTLGNTGIISLAWAGSCLYAGTSYNGVWRYDPQSVEAQIFTPALPFSYIPLTQGITSTGFTVMTRFPSPGARSFSPTRIRLKILTSWNTAARSCTCTESAPAPNSASGATIRGPGCGWTRAGA